MLLNNFLNLFPYKIAYAHCDIPCGIYDPHNAQLAAHTVYRMTQLIGEVKRDNETKAEHDIARLTHVKEEHASLLETELMTLQNDYFKSEIIEKLNIDIRKIFTDALKSNEKARVGIDLQAAEETINLVIRIAELFYKSKGIDFKKVKAPYPTGLDIVVQA